MILGQRLTQLSFIVFLFVLPASIFANKTVSDSSSKEFNVNEMIMHHVKDAHEWHLWGAEHGGVSLYLPVILYDNEFKNFSSRHLYHGKSVPKIDKKTGENLSYILGVGPAKGYALFHEKIYSLTEGELHFKDGHPHNSRPLDLSITKNVLSLFMGSLLIILILFSVARFYKKNGAVSPKGIAKFLEPLILLVQDDIAKTNIGEHKYKKYVPYLLTAFFFILLNNLLGMIPILPGGANLTGNISVTFFLALCTLLLTVFSGNKHYWRHIFATPGVPIPILIIMVPIEIVGIFTKPIALMIRLFANITAGHIIILALISLIFINKSIAWSALSVPMALFISILELLVAFLQAYLFTMLSALFIGAAVEEPHH